MVEFIKKINHYESQLYIKILSLSRNKLFYTKFHLKDTFQNRINLIFLHTAFLLIMLQTKDKDQFYMKFYQRIFDTIFKNIELNMREIGYGDIMINKNMRFLVKVFYNILLNCKNYSKKNLKNKNLFLFRFLDLNIDKKTHNNIVLVDYFNKYQIFCLDLSLDNVLKGNLNFVYK